MNWLFDALFHAVWLFIPAWLYVVAAIVGLLLVFRVFGWQATLGVAVAALVFLGSVFGAQKGRDAERAKQAAADQKARDTIAEKKKDVADDSDEQLDRRFNKWEGR